MAARTSTLRRALLDWYARAARDLPWRRTRDPYAIWVSEIMLQQTRVDTVLRYYDRFLQRFPTPYALAAADEDAVMAAWSGLGYYRRARLLHAGVREVVARYGGAVPEAADARRALPGIGRYTAGAVLSFAFGRDVAVLDTNVRRVLTRVFLGARRTARLRGDRRLWEMAEALVPAGRGYDFNQALMDFGATWCTPRRPRCPGCPMRGFCATYPER